MRWAREHEQEEGDRDDFTSATRKPHESMRHMTGARDAQKAMRHAERAFRESLGDIDREAVAQPRRSRPIR